MNTFSELGLTFEEDTKCVTCDNGHCHSTVYGKNNEKEYNVHIQTDRQFSFFTIDARVLPFYDDEDNIFVEFTDENEAVKFVLDKFPGFKCL